jgi:hypothetical protein
MFRRTGRLWLLTIFVIVIPLGGIALALYTAGRLAFRKPTVATLDPYEEWLRMRDQLRARRAAAESSSRVSHSAEVL